MKSIDRREFVLGGLAASWALACPARAEETGVFVGDVPWLRITSKGIKQKGLPKTGEAGAWFEDDLNRIKQHIAEQNLKIALTPDDVNRALKGEPHVVLSIEGATIVEDD